MAPGATRGSAARRGGFVAGRVGVNVLRALLAAAFLLPLLLGLSAAFRPEAETFRYGAELSLWTFLPRSPTLENFQAALGRDFFLRQLANTLVVGAVQSTLTLALAVLAAFPLARMRFRGKEVLFFAILATLYLPFEAVLVPLFLVVRDLGMLDSFSGLVLPWVASPIAVYLLRQAMQEIPRELDEAALVDGAGLWGILRVVVVPNVWPAMVTVWLFTFVFVWDYYLWPLVVIDDPSKQMVQVSIAGLFNPQERAPYGTAFAAAALSAGPVLVAFLFLQRFYMKGVALTGIK
jgi:ABC-type glycerol-3-phosphate transport system permease component